MDDCSCLTNFIMKRITSIKLKKWSDIHEYQKHGWLYRGQKDKAWELQTSLERLCNRLRIKSHEWPVAEMRLIRSFKRAYHQYASHEPGENHRLEWCSIMQHYGAPTRLLDFTYSIYVAAYFATEAAEQSSVVWAFHSPWCLKASQQCFLRARKNADLVQKIGQPFMENDELAVNELCGAKPYVQAVLPTNAFRLNERLRIQQGVFLIPGDVTKPFMKNLLALPGVGDPRNAIKIIIPATERIKMLKCLWEMNVSRAALFPGIDGYAQSLGVYHPLLFPTQYGSSSTPLIKLS
jgi:hypothetical protein